MPKMYVAQPRSIHIIETERDRLLEEIAERGARIAEAQRKRELWLLSTTAMRRMKEHLETSGESMRKDIRALQDQQDAAWEKRRQLEVERVLAYAVKAGVKPKHPTLRVEKESA